MGPTALAGILVGAMMNRLPGNTGRSLYHYDGEITDARWARRRQQMQILYYPKTWPDLYQACEQSIKMNWLRSFPNPEPLSHHRETSIPCSGSYFDLLQLLTI